MIVLKIIGWVLLSLLALIIIVLCIKVKISAEYSDDNTNVVLQWLFLKIPLYPSKPAAPKAEAVTDTEEAPAEAAPADETAAEQPLTDEAAAAPAEKKESLLHIIYRTHGIDGIMMILRRVFSYLGTFIGKLFNSVVIEEFYLDVGCTKKDAAATAVYYGEVCSALFPMLGALVSKYKVKKYDINIYPDFLARFSRASFYVKLHVYPIYLVGITLALVFKLVFKVAIGFFVKIFLSAKKDKTEKQNIDNTEKSEVSNERTVSGRDTVNNN